MSKKECIAAYTNNADMYPAFINISKLENGNFAVIVRGEGNGGLDMAEIELSEAAFTAILQTLNENIDVSENKIKR